VLLPSDLVTLGLATDAEALTLEHTESCFRMDVTVAWISAALQKGMTDGLLHGASQSALYTHLSHLRMWSANIGTITVTNQPNSWSSLMKIVVDMLTMLFVLGGPITSFDYKKHNFQWFAILYSSVGTFPWIAMGALIDRLHNPYRVGQFDAFNVDGIITWSERVLFTNMRAAIHMSSAPDTLCRELA